MIENQAQLDEWIRDLNDAGYPYCGEVGTYFLLDDGRIRHTYADGDEYIYTQEEMAESVYCWYHDC